MAPGWYNRRHWTIFRRELDELAAKWQKGRLLNIGCGHGADFLPFGSDFELCGVDLSPEMLRFARKYAQKFKFSPDLVLADAAALPFASGSFDWAIAVAAYHHIHGREIRFAAFVELARILKPGGESFVTVWNRWQPAFWSRHRDTSVRWRTKEGDLYRYYHLFSRPELERLVSRAGFQIVRSFSESSYRFPLKQFSRNICLIIRKTV